MSLLNRTNDGILSVLIVIFRLLLQENKISRKRLLALCAPGEIKPEKVQQTLRTWTELGLFEEGKNDEIRIHPDINKDERVANKLKYLARRLILRPENNVAFWSHENNRASDFTRALCWLLAQDAYAGNVKNWDTAQVLLLRQTPEDGVQDISFITNDTRWPGLKAWASSLGFCWDDAFPSGQLIIDPTEAVRDVLPTVFGRKPTTLIASDFIDRLATELPVLDGGDYRALVEEKLMLRNDSESWRRLPEGQLSTSLSRAISRLILEKTLEVESRADAPVFQRVRLSGPGNEFRIGCEYSHFSYKPGKSE